MKIPRKMISEHHCGKEHKISTILSALAAQEGCDDFECDVMNTAAEYIDDLEQYILDLAASKKDKI